MRTTPLILLFGLCWSLDGAAGADSCSDSSHALVQKLGVFPSSNGCSKPPGLSVGGEEDFTYCCDRHDACYSTCGISKAYCEQDFGKCMEDLCRTTFASNRQCSSAAQVYTMGTTMFGGNGFQDLQNSFCECVPKNDIKKHYAKLLEKVYKEHTDKSPIEASEVISKLLDKVGDSVPKLARLFYKITKKYETVIQHEGKRVGADPPRPNKRKQKSKKIPKQEL
jgi:secretory phospholipase A2